MVERNIQSAEPILRKTERQVFHAEKCKHEGGSLWVLEGEGEGSSARAVPG